MYKNTFELTPSRNFALDFAIQYKTNFIREIECWLVSHAVTEVILKPYIS